jgi:hypothetical protein
MRKKLWLLPMLLITTREGAQNSSSIWNGTWTENIAQSKLHPPAAKSETIVIGPISDSMMVKFAVSGTAGDDKPIDLSYDGKADGTHYSVMSGGKEIGKAMYVRQSAHHYTAHIIYNDGRTVSQTLIMSKSNRTFTVQAHVTSTDATYDETGLWNKH